MIIIIIIIVISIVILYLLAYLYDRLCQYKLSKLYDSQGNVICPQQHFFQYCFVGSSQYKSPPLLPFLPDEQYVSKECYHLIERYLLVKQEQEQKQNQVQEEQMKTHLQHQEPKHKERTKQEQIIEYLHEVSTPRKTSWALVTGASRGIGRAIVISLARRKIPIVLVARDRNLLEKLSSLVKKCYGVQTLVIVCDLCQNHAARDIALELEKNHVHIDILIHNAGMGDTNDLIDMSESSIENLCQVNMITVTKLTQILGSKMKTKKAGRIVFVSSLAGTVPGVPGAAVYAATKSYQKSLATSFQREMEKYGIGVTCVMPGAVKETMFASNANMMDAAIWSFPFGILSPETVAECTVNAMIVGRGRVVVGWMNVIMAGFLSWVLPSRCILFLCEFGWNALPFATVGANTDATRRYKKKVP